MENNQENQINVQVLFALIGEKEVTIRLQAETIDTLKARIDNLESPHNTTVGG